MIGETGVDELSNYLLEYSGGRSALLCASFRQSAPVEALIYGDEGYIKVPHFLGAKGFEVYQDNKEMHAHEFSYDDDHKFSFEIAHVNDCLRRKVHESPLLPLSKSVAIIELMDSLRTQFNLRYKDD